MLENISKALVDFHKEFDGMVAFDASNPFFKSRYATLGAVMEVINKYAPKHGLTWVQNPISEAGGVGVETTLIHTSGESITGRIVVPFSENVIKVNKAGDTYEVSRNVGQDAGIVITYLRRYALSAVFGLYADEDTDGELDGSSAGKGKGTAHTEPKAAVAGPAIEMTLEDACKVKDSDGGLYMDKTVELLATMHNSISKKMKAGGYSGDEQAEMDAKVYAIKVLIAAKNSGEVK